MPFASSKLARAVFLLLLGCVTLLGAAYLANGFYRLVAAPEGAGDLERRHSEVAAILRGENPYAIFLEQMALTAQRKPGMVPYDHTSVPAYPPWALPILVVTAGAPAPLHRLLFALGNAGALVLLAFTLARMARRELALESRWVLLGCFLISTIGMTLGMGQYGILVILAVLLAAEADFQRRPGRAGLLLALSLVKPNISLPLLLVFVVKKRFHILAVTAVTVSLLSLLGCWLIGTSPLAAFRDWLVLAQGLAREGDSPTRWLGSFLPHGNTIASLLVTVLAAGALWRQRTRGFLVLIALASFFGRVWTYHRYYDNMMLLPLMAVLGYLLAENPRVNKHIIVYSLLALTLWPSPRVWQAIVDGIEYVAKLVGASVSGTFAQLTIEFVTWSLAALVIYRARFRTEIKPAG